MTRTREARAQTTLAQSERSSSYQLLAPLCGNEAVYHDESFNGHQSLAKISRFPKRFSVLCVMHPVISLHVLSMGSISISSRKEET
ncbi:hypothetical protein J6590_069090 [Homalodisca vitripennis]|nr:hypothetical protein J6590_069090 [Homalodisca vitripennis]